MACRAEVLFKSNHPPVRKFPEKITDNRNIGTAPAVDALRVVADDEELAVIPRQGPEPEKLQPVDVLEFVSQHRIEAGRPVLSIGLIAEHGDGRPEQQIGKVRHIGFTQHRLIGRIKRSRVPPGHDIIRIGELAAGD